MSKLHFDLLILGLIIFINILITLLYRKYSRLSQTKNRPADLGNDTTTVSVTPGSFMPRIPFLILRRVEDIKLRKLIILHNILCLAVYGLFAYTIIFHFN